MSNLRRWRKSRSVRILFLLLMGVVITHWYLGLRNHPWKVLELATYSSTEAVKLVASMPETVETEGEVPVTLTLKNRSRKPAIVIFKSGYSTQFDSLRNSWGHTLPSTETRKLTRNHGRGSVASYTIPPGEAYTLETDVRSAFVFNKPGRYTYQACWIVGLKDKGSRKVCSNRVTFDVEG